MVPALTWELPVGSCVSALSLLLLCVCLLVSAFPHFPALQESSHFLSVFLGNPLSQGFYFLHPGVTLEAKSEALGLLVATGVAFILCPLRRWNKELCIH